MLSKLALSYKRLLCVFELFAYRFNNISYFFRKIEYLLFDPEEENQEVEVSIPSLLENSQNRIEVHVRDNDGIQSQRILNFWNWNGDEEVALSGSS